MLRHLFLCLCLFALLSCGGTGKVRTFSVPPDEVQEISYFSPIYSKQSPKVTASKTYYYFLKATNKALDSIFEEEPAKYRISKKINAEDAETQQRINYGINIVFQEIHKNKNPQDVKIPLAIRSALKRQNSRFALAVLISPDFALLRKRFPNTIVISGNPNSYSVKSITFSALIFDLKKNNVAFYRKVSGAQNRGYSKKIIKDLNAVYKSWFH